MGGRVEYDRFWPKWVRKLNETNYFGTVIEVDLVESEVTDLSPLENLTNLKELFVDHTQVSDLSPLEELTNLERLSVNHTQICDISHLAKLKKLEYLSLSNTQVAIFPAAGEADEFTNVESGARPDHRLVTIGIPDESGMPCPDRHASERSFPVGKTSESRVPVYVWHASYSFVSA